MQRPRRSRLHRLLLAAVRALLASAGVSGGTAPSVTAAAVGVAAAAVTSVAVRAVVGVVVVVRSLYALLCAQCMRAFPGSPVNRQYLHLPR